jgi:hypothetical protein
MAAAAIRTSKLSQDHGLGRGFFDLDLEISGVDKTGLVIILAIVIVGFAASAIVMQGRDLGA